MQVTQYGKHIVPIPVIPMEGEGNGSQGWDLWGNDLGNFEVNIAQRYFKELGRMNPEYRKRPHTHTFDEILFFLSSNTDDSGKLGSIAEMRVGKEEEKHIITESCLVFIPAKFIYCPISYHNVKRPFIFIQVQYAPKMTKFPCKGLIPDEEFAKMVSFTVDGTQKGMSGQTWKSG